MAAFGLEKSDLGKKQFYAAPTSIKQGCFFCADEAPQTEPFFGI